MRHAIRAKSPHTDQATCVGRDNRIKTPISAIAILLNLYSAKWTEGSPDTREMVLVDSVYTTRIQTHGGQTEVE